MRHPTEIKTPDHTWLDLNQDPIFHRFFAVYLDQLRKKLSQIEVHGNGFQYNYYTHGKIDHPSVSISIKRGEKIAQPGQFNLIEEKKVII